MQIPSGSLVRFLVHGAERSGPPVYLLRLLRAWAASPPAFRPELVIARPGPLVHEFGRLAPTRTTRLDQRSADRRAQRLVVAATKNERLGRASMDRLVRRRVGPGDADITVVNGATAPTAELLDALDPPGPVLLIAHELSTGWYENIGPRLRALLLGRVDRYLAVSHAVEEFLIRSLGIPAERVSTCRPPVPAPCDMSSAPPGEHGRESAEGGHPYTEAVSSGRAIVVGGAGVHDWRKAPELWLQLAARVRDRHPDLTVRFIWFGGHRADTLPAWPIRHETAHLGLQDQVAFLGEVEEPGTVYRQMDVFVSTAREDAYPLVCAEACASGVPVVTFDSGGASELVHDSGCGQVVPYPDLDAMEDRVSEYIRDEALRGSAGARGRAFAREHLSPDVVAPQVESWIMDRSTA